jgi:hypothetical protein
MSSPVPAPTEAQPERLVRLSEIPTEFRNLRAEIERWRGKWAEELTRAESLEREVRAVRHDLADANLRTEMAQRKASTYLMKIGTAAGENLKRMDALRDAHRRDTAELHRRIAVLVEWINHGLEHAGETVNDEHVRELVESAGVECGECDGSGTVRDEEMIGDPGSWTGYRTKDVWDDCSVCLGVGKLLR